MQKLVIAVTATAALGLCGSAFWVAQATPFAGPTGRPLQGYSPIEKIGCAKGGDICPYGQRIVRHSGHGPSCEPCSPQKQGEAPPVSGPPPSGPRHYDEGYDRGREGYDRGREGYDRGREDYDNRGYGREGDRDYSEGPPPGWRSYDERPYGWQERGCLQFGSLWYCP
jgi:hypothetical protein